MEDIIKRHYVCSECGYLSQHPGVCQTEGCMQEGSNLKSCRCEDGLHAGVMNRRGSDESEGDSDSPRVSEGQTVDLDNGSFE